uniref:Copper transport protein n=1 Tax=Lepeophtheirus salmonis TaxID=72036 RepID=D3PIB9_LEPSM|nr:High affinity copper uptake protein 1 [Lepeophtheirus salmonis]
MSGHHQHHHTPSASPSLETTNGPHEMMNTKPMDPSHGSHGHSSQSIMHNGHMMMFFHGGYEEVILFDFWRINTLGGLIWSMLICFLLSVSYEGIKFAREIIFRKYNAPFIEEGSNGNPPRSNIDDSISPTIRRALVFKNYIWSKSHFILTFLHILQVIVSYLLMLIFMTYNSWLCLSVIVGTGAGYFFFGWKRSSILDVSDHCH